MINRRLMLMVGVAALIGAIVAGVWASAQPDVYELKVVVAIAPSDTLTTDADVIDVIGSLDRSGITATAAGIATSRSVGDAAASTVGLDSLGDYEVDALRVLDSNLIDIIVSGPDPVIGRDLALATAAELQTQFLAVYDVYQIDIVSEPSDSAGSERPSVLLVALAGALVAGAVAAAAWWAAFAGRRSQPPADTT
jgi:capsular polysaccharide biosynthesis protein